MFADYHVHSHFSEDTDFPMELEIQKAIKLGMDELCFTEHSDYDVPTVVNCDYDAYFEEMEKMKDKYKGQITLKTGIEFGIQVHTTKAYEETFGQYPFDFVIFSCHQVENKEYWRQEPQKGKTQLEYNRRYYQEILDVVKAYKDYSILGHLDVIKRYDLNGEIELEKIKDLIDKYSARIDAIEQAEKEAKDKLEQEAQTIIDEGKEEIEEVIEPENNSYTEESSTAAESTDTDSNYDSSDDDSDTPNDLVPITPFELPDDYIYTY